MARAGGWRIAQSLDPLSSMTVVVPSGVPHSQAARLNAQTQPQSYASMQTRTSSPVVRSLSSSHA